MVSTSLCSASVSIKECLVMEKTLTIDGREVRFKSTAATALRYKAQFGRDLFADLLKMSKIADVLSNAESEEMSYEELEKIDFELFYNIIWVLAKTADKSIPEPIEWLDTFSEFPINDILPELQDLLTASFQVKKNSNQMTPSQ